MLVNVMPIYAIFGVALVLGTALSLLVGMVTLRISGMFFVIFGFGLSEMIREYARRFSATRPQRFEKRVGARLRPVPAA
jgi:ABC-type branched-subunit amino acid transport system permease subunit